jgi:uncharacterized Zn finger protein
MSRSTTDRSSTGQQDQRWWERRWLRVLRDLDVMVEAERVRQLVQGYRVRQLELSSGRIDADIYHHESGACTVGIEVAKLTDEQWDAVLDALSSQAIFSAQLLAGEMPKEIEQVFEKAGAPLMPQDGHEIRQSCSCCDDGKSVCRPALAAYLAVGDMLNDDPWLLLRLRGRDRQQILHDLGARRNQGVGASSPQPNVNEQSLVYRAGGVPGHPDDSPALGAEIDHFWGRSRSQLQFQHHIASPLIELVLLRRLGPPYFADDSFDVYDNLSAIYRTVTDAGLALAFSTDDDALPGDNDRAV